MSASSVFNNLSLAPPDSIFGLQQKFVEDTHPQKVNLVIGGNLIWQNISIYMVTIYVKQFLTNLYANKCFFYFSDEIAKIIIYF